jgi:hypothetical protein
VSFAINPANRRPNFHRGVSQSIFRHVIASRQINDARFPAPLARPTPGKSGFRKLSSRPIRITVAQ